MLGGDLTDFGEPAEVGELIDLLRTHTDTVLAVLGNCDPPEAEVELQTREADLNLRWRIASGLCFVGRSGADSAWGAEGVPEELAAQVSRTACEGTVSSLPVVLVSHAAPQGSGADRLPNGRYAGSPAMAQLAAAIKPVLVLCGHIHEARGVYEWQGATVVNPGPFRQGHYALVDVTPGQRPTVRLD